jgi:LDH2 family malate/lactate/ureidoglycolate dehydrogenase
VVSDFATTGVAEGKLRYAREKGVPLPEGWILDKEGRPSRDPADFYAGGTILPFGGHKGYALALVVELLSLALTGADATPQPDGWHSGALFLCLNPAAFRPPEAYDRGVTSILQRVKAVPPAPGFEEVLLPGEPERRTRAERSRDGIPLPDATWETLRRCAAELGVAPR